MNPLSIAVETPQSDHNGELGESPLMATIHGAHEERVTSANDAGGLKNVDEVFQEEEHVEDIQSTSDKQSENIEEVEMPKGSSSLQPVVIPADTAHIRDQAEQQAGEDHTYTQGDEDEYYEDEEQHAEDDEAIPDQTPLTVHTIPPIVLHLPNLGARSLFAPLPEDDRDLKLPVWLEGRVEELGEASLSDVWQAIRAEMNNDGLGEKSGEMIIVEKQMALSMGEVRLPSLTRPRADFNRMTLIYMILRCWRCYNFTMNAGCLIPSNYTCNSPPIDSLLVIKPYGRKWTHISSRRQGQ
jgi:hypothetical protein